MPFALRPSPVVKAEAAKRKREKGRRREGGRRNEEGGREAPTPPSLSLSLSFPSRGLNDALLFSYLSKKEERGGGGLFLLLLGLMEGRGGPLPLVGPSFQSAPEEGEREKRSQLTRQKGQSFYLEWNAPTGI